VTLAYGRLPLTPRQHAAVTSYARQPRHRPAAGGIPPNLTRAR
jgi:hypothetical protein